MFFSVMRAISHVNQLLPPTGIPDVGIICGTGMGALADEVQAPVRIPYSEIPGFPISTVESHKGQLVIGTLEGVNVVVMQGRVHRYEGYSLQQVTFPVRVMRELGCRNLIIMNAVGSMNEKIPAGSLMLVTDHINMMGDNPLIGKNIIEQGPRFPDMSEPYSNELRMIAKMAAKILEIKLFEGVLVAVTGPCLETNAEYKAFRNMGADCVTMSTIPEVIVAVHCGMKVLGISVVTDECIPDKLHVTELSEILDVARKAQGSLSKLVRNTLGLLGI